MAVIAIMTLGCAGAEVATPTLADPGVSAAEVPVIAMMTGPSCENSGTNYLRKCWANNVVIEVATSSSDPAVREQLVDGVNLWNSLLNDAPNSYRRSFIWSGTNTTGADAIVHVHGPATATFCGDVNPDTFVIDLFVLGTSNCMVTNSLHGDIATVLAHELSSVIGWAENVEDRGVAGVSDEFCVSTFPGNKIVGPLSTNMCYHDVNGIMRLYRFGTVELGEDYWSTKILATTDVALAASAVDSGQSVSISAQWLSAGPHAQYTDFVAYGPGNYSTSFSPSGVASRIGNTIRGDAVGSVNITFRPGSMPNGYALYEPLLTEGHTVALQVNQVQAPSVPPFKVDRITPDTAAITQPGWQTFTANFVSAPGTPVSTRWIVIDSRTPSVVDTIWRYGHTTLDVLIPSGESYTLSLTVRPHYHHIIGLSATQDIPVCTGEALLGGGAGKDGSTKTPPPTTNAIPGCGDPGGGEW